MPASSRLAFATAAAAAAAAIYYWRRRRARAHGLSRSDFCARAPKVELHVHLDGAFDASYLYACARRHVDALPASIELFGRAPFPLQRAIRESASEQDFVAASFHLPESTNTLVDFLAPFPISMSIVHTAMAAEGLAPVEEIASLFAKRQHESNVIYTEVRYNPHLFLDAARQAGPERYERAKGVVWAVARS